MARDEILPCDTLPQQAQGTVTSPPAPGEAPPAASSSPSCKLLGLPLANRLVLHTSSAMDSVHQQLIFTAIYTIFSAINHLVHSNAILCLFSQMRYGRKVAIGFAPLSLAVGPKVGQNPAVDLFPTPLLYKLNLTGVSRCSKSLKLLGF